MNKKLALLPLLFAPLVLPATAQQQYPVRAIRIVVGFPAGGPTDIVARQMAPKMSEGLGQQVIVDNRGGAGGMIATEQVAKAAPDGYTILMGTIGGVAVAMSLNPNRGYDTLRDLAPITQSVTVTSILVTHPSVPANNVRELLALARAKPGSLNYGSSGNGTITHLAGDLREQPDHHAAHQVGQSQSDCRHRRQTFGAAAGTADHRRNPARLQRQRLVRPAGTLGHRKTRDHPSAC